MFKAPRPRSDWSVGIPADPRRAGPDRFGVCRSERRRRGRVPVGQLRDAHVEAVALFVKEREHVLLLRGLAPRLRPLPAQLGLAGCPRLVEAPPRRQARRLVEGLRVTALGALDELAE